MDEQIAEQEAAEQRGRQCPGAQPDRAGGSSRSRSTAQQASRSGARGSSSRTSSSPAIRRSIIRERWRASRAAPPRAARPPDPERRLEPISLAAKAATGWFLLRMPWAARYSASAVVVDLPIARAAGPAGGRRTRKASVSQTALRGTSRFATPHDASISRRASGEPQAERDGLAAATEHSRPEIVEQRVGEPSHPATARTRSANVANRSSSRTGQSS